MDKNKIIEAAAKLVAKGAYEKAIKEYQRVLEADPKDVRILQKMGELYQKKNDSVQAAHYFVRVAESYSGDGFFLKAVALYKQVLKLNPTLIDVNVKLAELHQQLGLMSEAMAYFQTVANHYDKSGDARSSLDTLKKMVDLDPENIASRIKLAELYFREGLNREAIVEFKRAADYLRRNNRIDDYLRVAERISTLEPDNLELCKQLATAHLGRGDQKRALSKLQVCFKANSKDVETLRLLSQAFLGLGQTSKTISVYKELAQVLVEQGQNEESRRVWEKIEELDPSDPDLLIKASSRPSVPPRSPAEEAPAENIGPAPATQVEPSAAGISFDNSTKLLTETDVYLKYGLQDKALEHLRKVFAIDPGNLDAHEKAYSIYASSDHQQAKEQLLNVLRLCARLNQVQRAQPFLTTLLEHDPRHPELPMLLAALKPDGVGATVDEAVSEDVILVDADDQAVIVSEAPADALAEVTVDVALVNASAPDADEIVAPGEDFNSGGEAVEETVVVSTVADIEAPADEPPPDASPKTTVVAPDAALDTAHREDLYPEPAVEECNEAEFFLDQGLSEEACEILETILIAYPEHRRANELLSRISQPPAASAETQSAFDLAAELANEVGEAAAGEAIASATDQDFQVSVEEVFAEFKRGLQKVVKPEDANTHYDLGIAYKEMGLTEDAIGEFNVAYQACRGKPKEIDCLTMLGHIQVLKGDHPAAVASFEQALRSEFVTADSAKALEYELGAAWETLGKPGKALSHYQRVAKTDPRYRDVAKIIARLSATASVEESDHGLRSGRGVATPGNPAGKSRKVGYV